MIYKNKFCPVCSVEFNAEDDIVVCPECGTPHHRDCWNSVGHCMNINLHGGNSDISSTYTSENKQEEASEAERVEAENVTEQYAGDKKSEGYEKQFGPILIRKEYTENSEQSAPQSFLIEGRPSVLYDIAVRKNQRYYIPQFLTISTVKSKMASWNFCAFILPLSWSLYRKMYKLAALIFAIYMVILGASAVPVLTNEAYIEATQACMQEDPAFMENILLAESGQDVSLTPNQQKLLEVMYSVETPIYLVIATTVLQFGIRLFVGLKATKLYMDSITKAIDKGKSLGLDGDSLKMFIYRKKGTLPFILVALVGFFEWFMF